MTRTAALLVLLVLLVAAQKSLKCGASSGHTTKLEQSISLDIYGAPLSVKTLHTNIRIR